MDLSEGVSLAFRGEWKPFPTFHQSGRPKSASALLGKQFVPKPLFSGVAETKFEAQISGNHVVYKKTSFQNKGNHSLADSRTLGTTIHSTKTSHVGSSNASGSITAELSPAVRTSLIVKQRSTSRLRSLKTATSDGAIDELKAQKYKLQNMSTLIYHSVQQGCAFVPRASTTSKSASQNPSSFAAETVHSSDSKFVSIAQEKDAVSAAAATVSSKKRSTHESSMAKPSDPISELVTSICEIR